MVLIVFAALDDSDGNNVNFDEGIMDGSSLLTNCVARFEFVRRTIRLSVVLFE